MSLGEEMRAATKAAINEYNRQHKVFIEDQVKVATKFMKIAASKGCYWCICKIEFHINTIELLESQGIVVTKIKHAEEYNLSWDGPKKNDK